MLKCNFNFLKKFTITISILILSDLLFLLLFSISVDSKESIASTEVIICEGTKYQTVAYFFSAKEEGPAIMILAGVHGDELAGIEAAKKYLENFQPKKGTVIIIPEANKGACQNQVRAISPEEDLNRNFPGDSNSDGINRLAGEIMSLMKDNNVQFLLDLHESVDFYTKNADCYGQTIVLDDDNHELLNQISNFLIKQLNQNIILSENYFQVVFKPVLGSATYAALQQHDISGLTFETCTKLEFWKRVKWHYSCIKETLVFFDMMPYSAAK
jgi:hypothetical protein